MKYTTKTVKRTADSKDDSVTDTLGLYERNTQDQDGCGRKKEKEERKKRKGRYL